MATKEVQLSNGDPSGLVHVHGLNSVLDSVKVAPSREEYLTVGRSYLEDGGVLAIPVHLSSNFWSQRADESGDASRLQVVVYSRYVLLCLFPPSSIKMIVLVFSLTSQKVSVPVSVHFSPESACGAGGGVAAGELGWTSLLYFLLAHYQAVVILLLSCVACVVLTKSFVTKAAGKGGVESISMKPVKTPLIGGQPPVAQVRVVKFVSLFIQRVTCSHFADRWAAR